MSFSIKEIITAWKEEYAGRIPFQQGDPSVRVNCILNLLKTLLDEGYSLEEVKGSFTRNMIVGACHNPQSKKAVVWKKAIEDDIDRAMVRFNKQHGLEIKQFDDSNFKTVDVPAEHRVIPEPRPEVEYQERVETPSYVSSKPSAPPLDMSIYKGIPRPEVEYDQEFRKLMGFKK